MVVLNLKLVVDASRQLDQKQNTQLTTVLLGGLEQHIKAIILQVVYTV